MNWKQRYANQLPNNPLVEKVINECLAKDSTTVDLNYRPKIYHGDDFECYTCTPLKHLIARGQAIPSHLLKIHESNHCPKCGSASANGHDCTWCLEEEKGIDHYSKYCPGCGEPFSGGYFDFGDEEENIGKQLGIDTTNLPVNLRHLRAERGSGGWGSETTVVPHCNGWCEGCADGVRFIDTPRLPENYCRHCAEKTGEGKACSTCPPESQCKCKGGTEL